MLEQCYEAVDYVSLHHYHVAPPGNYEALLGGSAFYEDFITTETALCDLIQAKCRSPKKLMISFDEYGTMSRPCAKLRPGYGYHNMVADHYRFDPNRKYILHDPDNMPSREWPGGDMIPALTMASTILAFLRHADRVKIACMTGGLGALCSSNHDHVWRSGSHYVMTQLMKYGRGTSMQTTVDGETFDIEGYAIDDNSQYATKEGLNYVDAATAWDDENGSLNVFVINRSDKNEYPITLDFSGFEGYSFAEHIEMYTDDFKLKNTFDNPDALLPKTNTESKADGGELKADVKPLSWNIFRFEKK